MEYYQTIKKINERNSMFKELLKMCQIKNKQDWVVVFWNAQLKDNAAKNQRSLYVAIRIIVTSKEKDGWDWKETRRWYGGWLTNSISTWVLITSVLTL
jgi:hypothetical protein